MFSAAIKKAGVNPALIGDISVGNVLPAGGGASAARMAALHAGIPNIVPISTVNRQCASGLQAVNIIAGEINSGMIDIGIGAPFVCGRCIASSDASVLPLLSCACRCWCRVDDVRLRRRRDA